MNVDCQLYNKHIAWAHVEEIQEIISSSVSLTLGYICVFLQLHSYYVLSYNIF